MKTIDPIWTPAVQQQVFRHVLDAFAHPGTAFDLSGLSARLPAHLAVLATLLDRQTTLANPGKLLDPAYWPLLQAREAAANDAGFVLADGNLPPSFEPCLGSLGSPEHGSTLIVCVRKISDGPSLRLHGPGIAGSKTLHLDGLHPKWLEQRALWTANFPLGVDMIFADHDCVVALPRTTQLTLTGEHA